MELIYWLIGGIMLLSAILGLMVLYGGTKKSPEEQALDDEEQITAIYHQLDVGK